MIDPAIETAEELAREFFDHPNVVAALRARVEARDAAVARAAKLEVLADVLDYCDDWEALWAVDVMCEKLKAKYGAAKEPG